MSLNDMGGKLIGEKYTVGVINSFTCPMPNHGGPMVSWGGEGSICLDPCYHLHGAKFLEQNV